MGTIILFYKYVDIEIPGKIVKWQQKLCQRLGLKGRVIIATEGINGTLGGSADKINEYKVAMSEHPLFADIDFKESPGADDYFPRLRIVPKNEIVRLNIDPRQLKASDGGTHLDPMQAHQLIAQKSDDLVILDCRNTFESKVGAFEGAIRPQVDHFRDFPAYVDQHAELFKDKQVLMYCTGGVRCERGSAYIKSKGIAKEVYQIRGGIHRYIEQFPQGFFRGKNYVFDGRIAVRVTGDILANCSLCQKPCDDYQNCLHAACNKHYIACTECVEKYQNTCSQSCYDAIYLHNAPKRPMRSRENACNV